MRIVEAEASHLPGILAIYNEVVVNQTAIYDEHPSTLEARQAWFAARKAAGFPVLVALDAAGEVAGFSTYGEFRSRWGYRYTVEHSVHVRADLRGQGLGQALVEALFPIARAAGLHVMIGAVDGENLASIRFHERLGFEVVGRFPECGHKFGRWLELVCLQKLMDPPGSPRP